MLQTQIKKGAAMKQLMPLKSTFLIEALQKQIANAFNLYLNYKHYHWQTFLPLYRDLNVIFDEFANEVYATVEELAETVRTMDQSRVRVKEFKSIASIRPASEKNNIRSMIQEADFNARKIIGEFKELLLQAAGDAGLTAKLQKIIKLHEKHQWWLHYILDKRQGLTN